jgi:hypothetical protein
MLLSCVFHSLFALSRSLVCNPNNQIERDVVVVQQTSDERLERREMVEPTRAPRQLAEDALQKLKAQRTLTTTTDNHNFPESPMNFMYERDEDFQRFINDFARQT